MQQKAAEFEAGISELQRNINEPLSLKGIATQDNASGIVVELLLNNPPENVAELLGLTGARVRHINVQEGWATISLGSQHIIDKLSELDFVTQLNYAPPPIFRAGSVTSRAARALRANPIINSQTLDGTGLKIGVISDSFAQTTSVRDSNTTPAKGSAGNLSGSRPQDSGDLPAVVTLLNDSVSGTDEGAAMAELIHDIAPGAAIYFHAAGGNRREMTAAINALCDAGVDVIVDDVLFLFEKVYQDDIVALAAKNCEDQRGTAYFTAAGNDANFGHRYVYKDINAAVDDEASTPSGNDLHNWRTSGGSDGFMRFDVPANQKVYVILNWNQPGDNIPGSVGSQVDLDLYVTRLDSVDATVPGNSNFVARGAQFQGRTGVPSGEPVEYVVLDSGATAKTYYIAVEHKKGNKTAIPQSSAVPLEFKILYTGGRSLSAEYSFNGPTTWGHVLGEDILSVAAVPWWESLEFEPGNFTTPNIDPEPFTAVGGEQTVQFNSAGAYMPVVRTVPQFASVDGSNNTFLGSFSSTAPIDGEWDSFPNFFGTSAAAPNAAGIYLLLKQAFPDLTGALFLEAVEATAIDVTGSAASSGFDDVTGSGLIDTDAAYQYLANAFADTDGDGIADTLDNCPDDRNADQADTDGDNIGDVCDPENNTDSDGDSVTNDIDNCPNVANTDQADANNNGVGDVCESAPSTPSGGSGGGGGGGSGWGLLLLGLSLSIWQAYLTRSERKTA
ncbi:thrombospondin type 3 repeat-containing protein [Spongiibacter sp. KMU-158]|uniref:Thrombospondin type 3 repeat-containing protein n=1 Tax=Spongiibacter pelagi TaxID=2760804 RepID=A0A927GX54_9GAMM|nr:thrombospondin type 3 repeat-containing protein [Spongiibacter pelagi]MBD2859084.1 thrombospondin type 3 repeat-containing protein [Spongiibacter pelagi]